MTNPLRKRFFGDTETAQRYVGEAGDLLEAVHRQRGDLEVYQMHRVLGNGVELFAATRNGQDEIRINVSSRPRSSGGNVREYCVWEGDDELFSDPIEFYACSGPTSVDKDIFYMGGTTNPGKGSGVHRIPFRHGGASFNSNDMTLISNSSLPRLDNRSSGDIGSLVNEDDVYVMVADDVIKNAYKRNASAASFYPLLLSDPMHNAWLGYYSPDTSIFKVFSSGSEVGTVSRVTTGAVHGGNGDIYTYGANGISRFGLTTGINATYSLPDIASGSTIFIAVVKSGDIWLAAYDTVADTGWRVFYFSTSAGDWIEVNVENGFGIGATALIGDGYAAPYSPLHYDRITDAVCMVKANGSFGNATIEGAWIFNGTDCFQIKMAPFFRPFRKAELPPNIYGNGALCYASVAQFYNARIYIMYQQGLGLIANFPLSGPGSGNSLFHAGSYKVGRLLQKRQTNVE